MCEHDLDWILEDLAVGNINAGKNLDLLTHHGIYALVCAVPELPCPVQEYQKKGIALLHIPIDDSPMVDIGRWFDDVSDFIMAHRMMKKKILVHCYAGMSRSASLACAFLMNLLKWDDVSCLHWMKIKRPCININSGFLKQLALYGKKYKN
jgi:protein-tyrosine phosphatase